jgi:hypothetical protein
MGYISVILGLVVFGAYHAGKRAAADFQIENETNYLVDMTVYKKTNRIVITNIKEKP